MLAMAGGRCSETTEQKKRMWKYHRQRERVKNAHVPAAGELKRWGVVSLGTRG